MTAATSKHSCHGKFALRASWSRWASRYKNGASKEFLVNRVVAGLAAVTCGVLMSFMYGVLSIMKQKLGDPLLVGLICYLGALILSMIILPSPVAKHYSHLQTNRTKFEWWMFSGGILGVAKLSLLSLAASQLTDAIILVTLSYNLGQLMCAFITDHFGFLGTPKRHFSMWKLGALIIFASGLVCFSVENNKLEFRLFTLVSFVAGISFPIQNCINRRASEAMLYKPQANMVNYLGGFTTLAIIWLVIFLANEGSNNITPLGWFYYIMPAFVGFYILFCCYFFAPKLGLALFAMIHIFTEIITSVIVDHVGIFREDNLSRKLSWNVWVGFVVALAGTVITAFAQNKQNPTDDEVKNEECTEAKENQSDIVASISSAASEDFSAEIVDDEEMTSALPS
eukprot:GEMP01019476.1.p1 GENE.GEMP01019476.1~~GEMP01019476.1.p1  ORF type:complete len:397 (+),score=64.38 GEMP01019476.1:118-1308(+)